MNVTSTGAASLSLTAVFITLGLASVVAQTSVQTDVLPGDPALIQGQGDISAGKLVQSPRGETIGTVRGLIPTFPAQGTPDYVLVATQTGTAAIPYGAMDHMLRDAHLVVDSVLLADAPLVEEDQIHNLANSHWRREADHYWQAYRSLGLHRAD